MLEHRIENDRLVISVFGKVSSLNAAQFKEECDGLLEANPGRGVIMDCELLSYISSAGLRVLLAIKKAVNDFSLINVNSTVYEILDTTGFVEIMPVKKAFKSLSVEDSEVIGKGSNGLVYRIDPETVVKVYRNPDSLPDIENERRLARYAFVHQIPTAISYDIVKVEDSYGSVFELLNARSLSKLIAANPEDYKKYVTVFVELLKGIHEQLAQPGDVPSIKDTFLKYMSYIENNALLPEAETAKLKQLVEAVPEDYHLVHGDYHSNNIMMQDDSALLIDLDTLSHGNPVFEFASIFNAYIGFEEITHNVEQFLRLTPELASKVWQEILRQYFEGESDTQLQLREDRYAVLGYMRLLRRQHKRYGADTPAFEVCRDRLLERLAGIDSLV